MKRIRFRVILFAFWLIGFWSMQWLLEPIHFSFITYLLTMGMVIVALASSRLARVTLWALLIIPASLFLAIKIWLHPLADGIAILLTIGELAGMILTTFLAYRVSQAICEFEDAVAHITIGHRDLITENSSLGTASLYREVRRSRNHKRPLALLAVAIDDASLRLNLDRMVQEAQQAMIKQYARADIARLLSEKLEDCDIIVQNNEHFLVLLPETQSSDLPGLIERLRRQALEQVGVELKIGSASLPQDSYTLEGLVEQATREIKTEISPEFFLDLKKVFVNQQVT